MGPAQPASWERWVHKPTLVWAVKVTAENHEAVRDLLAAEPGQREFAVTSTYVRLETQQGDSRNYQFPCTLIKRWSKTRFEYEVYPVDPEVDDDYEPAPEPEYRFTCATCERHFFFARDLVEHICEQRAAATEPTPVHDLLAGEFAVREARRVFARLAEDEPLWGTA